MGESMNLKNLDLSLEESRDIIEFLARTRNVSNYECMANEELFSTLKKNPYLPQKPLKLGKRKNTQILTTQKPLKMAKLAKHLTLQKPIKFAKRRKIPNLTTLNTQNLTYEKPSKLTKRENLATQKKLKLVKRKNAQNLTYGEKRKRFIRMKKTQKVS